MNLRGGGSGLGRAVLHVGDVGGDLLRTLGSLLDVARYLLRRRTLLFHRRRNGRGYLGHAADGAADLLDRCDRFLGRWLKQPTAHWLTLLRRPRRPWLRGSAIAPPPWSACWRRLRVRSQPRTRCR